MSRLLAVASWWCGRGVASLVFEPLLADWQHDLEAAKQRGAAQYVNAFLRGLAAYVRSLATCTITRDWVPTSRAAQIVALTCFVTFDAALFLLWIASLPSGYTADLSSLQTRAFLLSRADLAFAPILLPALFLMRRDARSTARHAISVITAGAILTAGVVWLRSPENLNRYFSTFESYEADYQRNLANDRAGRISYPATAVRQLTPTTIEQRRAAYERFMASRAEWDATRAPVTLLQQLRRYQPVALAMLFGVMGWTLAGLGPVTHRRAAMWWGLIYVTVLTFSGAPLARPSLRTAYPALVFALMTIALVITSWRKGEGTNERRT